MKLITVLFGVILLPCANSALGQKGFTTVAPDKPPNLNILEAYASVTGHWVPVDKDDKKSAMTGPSVSSIACIRASKVCTESQANIVVTGNFFSMNADTIEYTIERWNSREIVAANVGGICRVRNVLKFDLVNKRVYWMQSLSEPTNDLPKLSKEMCGAVGMYLELKDSTAWIK